jgi:hypothetical protein
MISPLFALVPILAIALLFLYFRIDDNKKKKAQEAQEKARRLEMGDLFCVDCKHCEMDTKHSEFSKCSRTKTEKKTKSSNYYFVNGSGKRTDDIEYEMAFCSVERTGYFKEDCGPDGKYFEKKG